MYEVKLYNGRTTSYASSHFLCHIPPEGAQRDLLAIANFLVKICEHLKTRKTREY